MSEDMTLGEATDLLASGGWACACPGHPPGETRCYCQLTVLRAQGLQRAAHIVARQFTDYARGRSS